MDKPKVMMLSDSPLTTTGYARISTEIMNGLDTNGWDCHYIAHNLLGQTLAKGLELADGSKFNFKIHGTDCVDFGKNIVRGLIEEHKPDIFITLLDTFMPSKWYPTYDFSPAKTVFYFPTDGESWLPSGCEAVLNKMNYNVAMAKYGQQQVKKAHDIDAHYIPHAIDENLFYPLSTKKRKEVRQKWKIDDFFIIGIVARNQPRKMLDRTFDTFKLICDKYSNARLFFHCDPYDAAAYFDMAALIKRRNLENRVLFSGVRYFRGFDYKKMNEIYNCMDIFLLTTSGEGFGIPIIEAMACEVPVLATDYTTTKELVTEHNSGLPIKLQAEMMGTWNVYRGLSDLQDGAQKIAMLINNPKMRKELGVNGRKAVLENYTWDIVNKEWNRFLREALEKW